MAILDTLQGIYFIGKTIYKAANGSHVNQAQCKRLTDRISIMIESVKGLEKVKDSERYEQGLLDFRACLKECSEFIQGFSKKSWFKRVLTSNTKKFMELNDKLCKCMAALNVGINAQQIMNREQDRQDQAADFEFIQKNLETIVKLNQQSLKALDEIKLSQEDQKATMANAFQSMRNHIRAIQVPTSEANPLLNLDLAVPYYSLVFHEKVAEGSFGKVFRGKWLEQIVAIKTLQEIDEKSMEEFNREVSIMGRLRHQNIVQLYAACIEREHPCLVMEYMGHGSLSKVLEEMKLTPYQQKQIALDVAKGLFYLHEKKVLHRDLKSANILLNDQGQAKITDFGLSKMKGNAMIKTIKKETLSIEWQAPEALRRGYTYVEAADIYSYGMILWEIMTGRKPYAGLKGDALVTQILSGKQEEIPSHVPEVYRNLILSCWSPSPAKRPTAKKIIHALSSYQVASTALPEDIYQHGTQLEREGKLSDAREQYEKAAKEGFVRAYTNIGFFYLRGLGGLKQNKKEAYNRFLKGAQGGHARAMEHLGRMYENGDEVKLDQEQALKWYEASVKAGNTRLQGKCDELRKLCQSREAVEAQPLPLIVISPSPASSSMFSSSSSSSAESVPATSSLVAPPISDITEESAPVMSSSVSVSTSTEAPASSSSVATSVRQEVDSAKPTPNARLVVAM